MVIGRVVVWQTHLVSQQLLRGELTSIMTLPCLHPAQPCMSSVWTACPGGNKPQGWAERQKKETERSFFHRKSLGHESLSYAEAWCQKGLTNLPIFNTTVGGTKYLWLCKRKIYIWKWSWGSLWLSNCSQDHWEQASSAYPALWVSSTSPSRCTPCAHCSLTTLLQGHIPRIFREHCCELFPLQ